MAPFSDSLTSDEGGDRVRTGKGEAGEIRVEGESSYSTSDGAAGVAGSPLYRERKEEAEQGRPTEGTGRGFFCFHLYNTNEGLQDTPVRITARGTSIIYVSKWSRSLAVGGDLGWTPLPVRF